MNAVKPLLTKDVIAKYTKRNNAKGLRLVAFTWLSIAAIFTVAALFPNPIVYIAAIFLLGGRMLALAILMHDCGHNLLFDNKSYNQKVGDWLCAYPVFSNLSAYAKGHLQHHRYAGTEQDPDLSNYRAYPVSKESFKNKMVRDFTGQTGFKLFKALVKYSTGEYAPGKLMGETLRNGLIIQLILLAVLSLFGQAQLYLLWAIAWFTTFMFVQRIRQISDHAAVPDFFSDDPRLNTRTAYPTWWERVLFAPHNVNYHVEHHILTSVPCYNLRAFHAYLKSNNALNKDDFGKGYFDIVKAVTV